MSERFSFDGDYSIRLAEGVTVKWKMDDGGEGEMSEHQAHTGLPIWAPWSGDEHFNVWSQTCPLNEWVRYEGPRFSADVYMTQRPAAVQPPEICIDAMRSWIPRRRRKLTYRGFRVVDFGERGHPFWTAYQNAVRWYDERWWEWRGKKYRHRTIDHFRLP